jgi:hypothetical protein
LVSARFVDVKMKIHSMFSSDAHMPGPFGRLWQRYVSYHPLVGTEPIVPARKGL